jgi:four helix bundle protein
MALAKQIYEITRTSPCDERLGLVAQMRRAALSIPEGQARHATGEFVQFISHAEGSLAELETQLRLGLELRRAAQNAKCTSSQADRTLKPSAAGCLFVTYRLSLVTCHYA